MYVERIIQAQVYPRASITLVLRLYLYLYLKSRYMRYGAVGKKSVGNFTIVQFNKAPINRFPCQWDFEVNGTFFGNGKPCEQYTRRNNIWSNVIHSMYVCVWRNAAHLWKEHIFQIQVQRGWNVCKPREISKAITFERHALLHTQILTHCTLGSIGGFSPYPTFRSIFSARFTSIFIPVFLPFFADRTYH